MAITSAEEFKAYTNTGVNTNAAWIAKTKTALEDLKEAVKAGTLTVSQYQQIVEPNAQAIVRSISGGLNSGSRGAGDAANAGAYDILDQFFSKDPVNSSFKAKLPFSKAEYAQLPESSLPTQDEAKKGLFDPSAAPLDRYQGQQTGTSANGGTGLPSGGIEGGPSDQGRDEKKLLEEANFAQDERKATQAGNVTQQQDYIKQITDQLIAQQQRQFTQDQPAILEDLNSRGLLRSSALGDRYAKEQKDLAEKTSLSLGAIGAQAGLNNLGQNTAITESYLGDRGSAIGRRFSLEDYARQLDAARTLGSTNTPQVSGGGKGGAGGAAAGTLVGAGIGGALGGPAGASVGATVGGTSGGYLGGK